MHLIACITYYTFYHLTRVRVLFDCMCTPMMMIREHATARNTRNTQTTTRCGSSTAPPHPIRLAGCIEMRLLCVCCVARCANGTVCCLRVALCVCVCVSACNTKCTVTPKHLMHIIIYLCTHRLQNSNVFSYECTHTLNTKHSRYHWDTHTL